MNSHHDSFMQDVLGDDSVSTESFEILVNQVVKILKDNKNMKKMIKDKNDTILILQKNIEECKKQILVYAMNEAGRSCD